MNRRSFISLAVLSPFIRAINPKDLFFDEIKLHGAPVISNMNWDKNIFFINQCFTLYVKNPRALGVITNIGLE
jgi:hypothetical protein